MNKYIQRIIFATIYAILFGCIVKHFGFQVALLTILILIYIELFIGDDKE